MHPSEAVSPIALNSTADSIGSRWSRVTTPSRPPDSSVCPQINRQQPTITITITTAIIISIRISISMPSRTASSAPRRVSGHYERTDFEALGLACVGAIRDWGNVRMSARGRTPLPNPSMPLSLPNGPVPCHEPKGPKGSLPAPRTLPTRIAACLVGSPSARGVRKKQPKVSTFAPETSRILGHRAMPACQPAGLRLLQDRPCSLNIVLPSPRHHKLDISKVRPQKTTDDPQHHASDIATAGRRCFSLSHDFSTTSSQ